MEDKEEFVMMNKVLSVILALAMIIVPCFALAEAAAPSSYTLTLDGNPTTGYEWTAAVDNADVAEVITEYVANDAEGLVGASGHYTFQINGKQEGTATVTLTYARSWESDPLYTMVLTVAVDAGLNVTVTGSEFHEGSEEVAVESLLNFDISMDKIPEGYTMEKTETEDAIYVEFYADGKPDYIVSVAYSEYFEGYTLNVDDLADEELSELTDMLSEGYNAAAIAFDKTAYGTGLIIVDETDSESDYAEILSIYDGYFITATIMSDEELTDEDFQTAITILSDMWMIEK